MFELAFWRNLQPPYLGEKNEFIIVTMKIGVGLRPFTCWDCGFESYRGHGSLFIVTLVCCQVEVSATSWSLVQRSPTGCVCVCVCDLETSGTRRSRPDLCGCTTKSVISAGNNRTRYLVIVWEQQEFPPPRRPNWLWGPSSFLLNGYRGSFSRVEWPRREPNHQTLYLAPRFRRNRAITLLPCTHSWHKQEKITNHDRSSDADIEKEATINWTLR